MPAKSGILLIICSVFWRYLKVGLSAISFLLVLDTKLQKSNFTRTDVKKDATLIPNALIYYVYFLTKVYFLFAKRFLPTQEFVQ